MTPAALPDKPVAETPVPAARPADQGRRAIAIDRIGDTESFAALRHEWTVLLRTSRADCLFLTWEWLFTWWQHCAQRQSLAIFTARSGGKLVGLAPLMLAPRAPIHVWSLASLQFLGSGTVGSDYLDLIVDPEHEPEVVTAMADHLARLRLVVAMSPLRLGHSAAWRLGRELASRGWSCTASSTMVCPFISLTHATWETYLDSRGRSHRTNVRRRLRQAAAAGARFERVETDEERSRTLREMIALHTARWRRQGGSNAFDDGTLVAFHDAFTRVALDRGWLRLYALRQGGQLLAGLYGFRYGSAFLFYQSGFDERHAHRSVGLVTMAFAIKAAIEEGAAEFDLLHGDEAYKFRWADEVRELGRVEGYPDHPLGALCRHNVDLSRAIRRTARRVLSRTPQTDARAGGGPSRPFSLLFDHDGD